MGCTIGVWGTAPLVFIVAAGRYIGFLELKKRISKRVCFGCGGIFWCSDWHKSLFCFAPLHVTLKFMPHTAALCCKKQQQQKTPPAQQYTSSLLAPCAHGRLNVKHHRTTP